MFKKIKSAMLITILPVIVITLAISLAISIYTGKSIIKYEIEQKMISIASLESNRIENFLKLTNSKNSVTADFVSLTYDKQDLSLYENILVDMLESNTAAYGHFICFEPYIFDKTQKYVTPYVSYKDGIPFVSYDYSNADYDYLNQEFYLKVKETKKPYISGAVFDKVSEVYMITMVTPILDHDKNFIGCVGTDIDLSYLSTLVNYYNTDDKKMYIVDKAGNYITNKDFNKVKNGDNILNEIDDYFLESAMEIANTDSGTKEYIENGIHYIIYYCTLEGLDWKLIIATYEDKVNAPILAMTKYYVIISIISILVIILAILLLIRQKVEKPIETIITEFDNIAKNSYDTSIPANMLSRGDEFGILANALGNMKTKIKDYQLDLEDSLQKNLSFAEETQQQNESLIESENHLRDALDYINSIFNAIPHMIYVFDSNGNCIDNRGNEREFLSKDGALVGKNILEFNIDKNLKKEVLGHIKEVAGTDKVTEFKMTLFLENKFEKYEMRAAGCSNDTAVIIGMNTTGLYNHIEKIEYLSYHDQLTGLFNRRYFDELLLPLVSEENYPCSIVSADVNNLKLINDSFGHLKGDELLLSFASVLNNSIIADENIVRVGGDEFTIILPRTSNEKATKLIDAIKEDCKNYKINGITLSVSFGISTITSNKTTVEDAIKQSEDLMYQNKMYEAPGRRAATIEVIRKTLAEKNPREQAHADRVGKICELFAIEYGMSEAEQQIVKTAGTLHDIGKIGISEDLLNKREGLTDEEYVEVRKHPDIGYRILQSAGNMKDIAEIVLAHHERWDGHGYPKGISGDTISVKARMVAIVDAYDAIINTRTYRDGQSTEICISELRQCSGTQFDPTLVELFIEKVLPHLH